MNYSNNKTTSYPYLRCSVLIILLTSTIMSISLLSSVPPVSRDALTHHLSVPKLWLMNGGICELPHLKVSYYPMNLDLLYLIPLYFGNDIIPKYIHFAFSLLTATLLFSYITKRINFLYGLLGSLFFLSIPIIVKLSITAYVDLALIFFSTSSFVYLLKWKKNCFKIKYLIISSVCCGLALGTKYNGLILLLLLPCFIPFIYLRSSTNDISFKTMNYKVQLKATGYAVLFIFISLIIFSPWMIKNYFWTGNPIYPLGQKAITNKIDTEHVFNDANSNTMVFKQKNDMSHFLVRKIIYKETWWETTLIPIRIFFQGEDDNPIAFDGKLNPFLLLLSCIAFFSRKKYSAEKKAEVSILLSFSVLYLFCVFFLRDMRIRWIGPIIPPLVILSMYGLKDVWDTVLSHYFSKKRGILPRSIFAGVILSMLFINASYIINLFDTVEPFSYITGKVDRETYIEKRRPEFAALRYANKNLKENSRIMGIFVGQRGYYSNHDIFFNFHLLDDSVKSSKSSDNIAINLNRKGITHLLIKHDIFGNWVKHHFNEKEKSMLNDFFNKNLKMVFSKNGYHLYQCI